MLYLTTHKYLRLSHSLEYDVWSTQVSLRNALLRSSMLHRSKTSHLVRPIIFELYSGAPLARASPAAHISTMGHVFTSSITLFLASKNLPEFVGLQFALASGYSNLNITKFALPRASLLMYNNASWKLLNGDSGGSYSPTLSAVSLRTVRRAQCSSWWKAWHVRGLYLFIVITTCKQPL